MIIEVSLRGEPLFEYEADDVEIEKLMEEFEDLAATVGQPAMAVANSVLKSVSEKGLPSQDPERRGAMAWITYLLLHTDTHHPDHPGKYFDYAAAWDFEFDLLPRPDGRGVDIKVLGGPFASPT
jgi:hypothetical protein